MQVLEEESQVYFSANELGSASTMLQLLFHLFKAYATKQTFLHILERQEDCGMSLLYTYSLLLLMYLYN